MAANGRIGKKEAPREIDLKGVPFSLEDYFGIENIIEICNKENIRITGNNCCDYSEYEDLQTEQNITLVQYYYK